MLNILYTNDDKSSMPTFKVFAHKHANSIDVSMLTSQTEQCQVLSGWSIEFTLMPDVESGLCTELWHYAK